jgi:hypothetical protein
MPTSRTSGEASSAFMAAPVPRPPQPMTPRRIESIERPELAKAMLVPERDMRPRAEAPATEDLTKSRRETGLSDMGYSYGKAKRTQRTRSKDAEERGEDEESLPQRHRGTEKRGKQGKMKAARMNGSCLLHAC